MGGKSEALTKQFEAKVQEALSTLQGLTDADWTKVTDGEKWTVGVTAHHLASAMEPVTGIVSALAAGQPLGQFTRAMLDEMNAQHAREHASCTKAETIALLKKGAAGAAAVVRRLSDEQLARTGTVFADAPRMSTEQMITGALLDHIDEHFGSIRKTVGVSS
jgi:Mycothiol maleylpyruvate isomerase N-terminal domain